MLFWTEVHPLTLHSMVYHMWSYLFMTFHIAAGLTAFNVVSSDLSIGRALAALFVDLNAVGDIDTVQYHILC